MLRVLSAAFRVGDVAALAKYAADETQPEKLRTEALTLIGSFAQVNPRERVTGLYRPLPARDAQLAARALDSVIAYVGASKSEKILVALSQACNAMRERRCRCFSRSCRTRRQRRSRGSPRSKPARELSVRKAAPRSPLAGTTPCPLEDRREQTARCDQDRIPQRSNSSPHGQMANAEEKQDIAVALGTTKSKASADSSRSWCRTSRKSRSPRDWKSSRLPPDTKPPSRLSRVSGTLLID
jgi:hypothetical protein